MKDYILRAADEHKFVRLFVAVTKDLVEEGRQHHMTSPVATAAFGRLLTAGSMMGAMMKGDKDLLTLQIKGDGPIGTVLVTATSEAKVKGYVGSPIIDIPTKSNGKLDVSGAVGKGTLNVIRDIGMKDPYNGQIELVSGEIADDLTYYFASSEQTPSVVALGVLVDKDYSVKQSGGLILQLLPNAPEEVISQIEKNIHQLPSVTSMLESGMDGKAIVDRVLLGLNPQVMEEIATSYECDCSKEKVEKALMTIGTADLQSMIDDNETIDTSCHFCSKHYAFTVDDLQEILHEINKV